MNFINKARTWIFILALIIGGPIFALNSKLQNEEIAKIINHGKTATATIKKVEWTNKHHLDGDYKLQIIFTPEGGAPTKHTLAVDDSVGSDARDDKISTVDVKYLPEDPTVVFPADVNGPSNAGFYIGGVLFLAGICMIAFHFRKKSHQQASIAS
ncbi:hypothetical protein [Burkholderia sp. LMG 32019]|uniref:hypothetical protein n=1 Tax=Burkholderia sp. LMG 32019 TaxID=3158173 RepID=UPI003C2B5BE2